jgi:aspartyl-tRNA(Asn)/glutamyl-tRNA(Gln) amidotransferase subunit C
MNIEDIKHIAELARLSLNEEEIEKFTSEFGEILEYVSKLREVEVDAVKEKDMRKCLPLRGDKEGRVIPRKKVIDSAPENKNGYISVPKVL